MQNYAFEMIQAMALAIFKYIFKKNRIFIDEEITYCEHHRFGRILTN